jgi:hypothetical protein
MAFAYAGIDESDSSALQQIMSDSILASIDSGHGDASAGEPKIRKIEGPAAEPLNLQSVAGGAMMKRLLPIAGAILGIFLFIVRPFRRRRNRES